MRASLVGTAFVCGLFVWGGACGGTSSTTTDASDSGTPGTDARAPLGDAGGVTDAADSGAVMDANVPCSDCVTGTLSWGDNGGLVAYRGRELPRDVQGLPAQAIGSTSTAGRSRAPRRSARATRLLSRSETWSARSRTRTSSLRSRSRQHLFYGVDSRPVDGTVFRITRNGKSIDVGGACGSSPAPACVPIPPGVDALASALRSLDTQELAKPACNAFD